MIGSLVSMMIWIFSLNSDQCVLRPEWLAGPPNHIRRPCYSFQTLYLVLYLSLSLYLTGQASSSERGRWSTPWKSAISNQTTSAQRWTRGMKRSLILLRSPDGQPIHWETFKSVQSFEILFSSYLYFCIFVFVFVFEWRLEGGCWTPKPFFLYLYFIII